MITKIIKKHMNKNKALYRTGGDEFMIVCYRMDESAVQLLIKQIQDDLENTPYRWAIGYAIHNSHKALDSTCQKADGSMYKNKLMLKSQLQ